MPTGPLGRQAPNPGRFPALPKRLRSVDSCPSPKRAWTARLRRKRPFLKPLRTLSADFSVFWGS
jgi:hypothetical protein